MGRGPALPILCQNKELQTSSLKYNVRMGHHTLSCMSLFWDQVSKRPTSCSTYYLLEHMVLFIEAMGEKRH